MENYDDRTRCFQKTNFLKGKTFSIFNSQFSIRPAGALRGNGKWQMEDGKF
jgi:hypothetical protein